MSRREGRIELPQQGREGIAQFGGFAEALASALGQKDQAAPGFGQRKTLALQAVAEIGPRPGIGKVISEERPQGSNEPLIRPDGRLRFFAAGHLARDGVAHQSSDRNILCRCDLLQGEQRRLGQFEDDFAVVHAGSLDRAWLTLGKHPEVRSGLAAPTARKSGAPIPGGGSKRMSLAFFVCLVVTLISTVVSLGFSLVAIWSSEGEGRDLALYAAARSFAFLLLSLVPWLTGSVGWLQAVAWGMIVVQALDAGIGHRLGDRTKTWGPLGISAVNLVAVFWLMLVGY